MSAKFILLHPQDNDGMFLCQLVEADVNGAFTELLAEMNARAIMAILDLKRRAILSGHWTEKDPTPVRCPECESSNVRVSERRDGRAYLYSCNNCGSVFPIFKFS